MPTLNFSADIRIFAARMGENACDMLSQVATVERLPNLGVTPGLAEARRHLLEVAAHLRGDTTFQGSPLELHAASVCSRGLRLAAAFAREDLAAERSGRDTILTSAEWYDVHRAVLAGTAGQVPVLRRIGTFHPPKWALDLIEMTTRLAEVGWGPDEVRLKARALAEPTAVERRAAADHTARMIARKDAWLASRPEALEEATAWWGMYRHAVEATPRPAGGLDIDGVCWIRLPAAIRQTAPSRASVMEVRQMELAQAGQTVVRGHASGHRFTAHREVVGCLADNGRKAREFARCARPSGNRPLRIR